VASSDSSIESAGRRSGRRRFAVASGSIAAGLAAALAGATFGLQAVTLPRPSPGQLMAAKTMRWLTRHDAVESVKIVHQRPVSSLCVNAVVGPLRGSGPPGRVHGSLLITPHARLLDTRFAAFRVGRTLREEDGAAPSIQAVLAGCPRALERRIGGLLDDRVPVGVKRILRGGEQLVRLAFARRDRGLFLIVALRTFAPVAVRIARGRTGWTSLAPAERRDLVAPSLRLSRRLRLVVKEDV